MMRFVLLGLLGGGLLVACNSSSVSPNNQLIPSVPVNVQLDLLDQQNKALLFDNGVVIHSARQR
ncbi:MAG: hypothetical protein WKG07_25970 [Hymenobacter sp.]